MSWTDHDSHQRRLARIWAGRAAQVGRRVLAGSVGLGNWGGVYFYAHVSLFWWLLAVGCLAAGLRPGLGWRGGAVIAAVWPGLLLFHELARCLSWAAMGYVPRQLVVGPVGGMVQDGAVQRRGACGVGALCGLAAHAVSAAICMGLLADLHVEQWNLLWHPLRGQALLQSLHGVPWMLGWTLRLSILLLLLDFLPVWPLDGFDLLKACRAPRLEEGPDDAEHLHSHRRRRLSRRLIARVRRRAQQDQAELQRIDTILAKVGAHGLDSLTWLERHRLHQATLRRQRSEIDSHSTT